jgi:hypothetical protein
MQTSLKDVERSTSKYRGGKQHFFKASLATCLFSFSGFLFATPRAAAQGIQQFVGHVADTTGAAVPGATVTIRSEGTGLDVVVKTTGAGDYTAPYLKPGKYSVTASMAGFQTVSKTHINLDVDQTSKMDFALQVGNVNETLTVNADAAQIELAKADRGETIEFERVQELPLDGRNAFSLFALSPGTQITTNPIYPRQFDNVNQGLITNGVSINPAAQYIDNLTNDNAGNYSGYNVPLDSVGQFKVVLNAYDASYGRSAGSVVNVAVKSGTNKVHGVLYEYARRQYLDANSWIYNYAPTALKSKHSRDQFGAQLEGPVYIPHLYNGRDRTFFELQWEQQYESIPNTTPTIASLPDPKWLTGDFSNAQYYNSVTQSLMPLIIYDPLSPLVTFRDPLDGKTKTMHSPFPGNIIPKNRLDPVGLGLAQYYGGIKPNYNPGAGYAPFQNNFYWIQVESDVARNGTIKLDQVFGDHDRATVRWGGFERFANQNPNGIPASNAANQISSQVQPSEQQYAVEEIHTFSPNFIMNNKAILSTYKQGLNFGTRGNYLSDLGFSQNFISNSFQQSMIPYVTSSSNQGGNAFIPLSSTTPGRRNIAHELAYEPDVTYVHGKHTLRAGLDLRLLQYTTTAPGQNNQFGFTNTFSGELGPGYAYAPGYTSGSAIASMLLGYPDSGSSGNQFSPFYSQHYYGLWVQDDFKLTPKLTLNLGIRYDLLGARTERHDRMNAAFNPTAPSPINAQLATHGGLNGPLMGGITFAGVNGTARGAYATNLTNIQPRFGAAYAFSDKTSLRFGFGEFFVNDESVNGNGGFASSTSYTNSLNNGITPYGHLSDPYPSFVQPLGSSQGLATGAGGSLSFINPNYRIPSVWQYSVSVEQLLTSRDTLDISATSTRAHGLPGSDDINHVSAAYYAQCDVERGGNRQLCDGSGYPAKVANPFYQVGAFKGTSYYSTSTISAGALTRPFPQFTGITESNLNQIHSWYNSLQVTASHRASRDLTFHFAYTWSKNMQEGNLIDTVNRVYGRSLQANDRTNILTLSGVYYLPVGRGKLLLGHTNRLVDAVVGGWQVAPSYVYNSGNPWFPGSNFRLNNTIGVPFTELPYDATHAYKRIRGASPCVGYEDQDTGVVTPGPSYSLGGCTGGPTIVRMNSAYSVQRNVVYTGVRYPSIHQFDASLSKRFTYNEKVNLQLRMDAINVLNHPNFSYSSYGDGYSNDPTNTNWGTISKGPQGPANPSRELQIAAKFSF